MIDYSIIGKRFGRLVVMDLDHICEKRHSTWWRCRCDCGNETIVYRGSLTSGDTTSCGCLHKEGVKEYSKTHGLTSHPLYTVWCGMNQRCRNPNSQNFNRYGGRGIEVCEEWSNDFVAFYDWAMSSGYRPGLTLDRKNNNDSYNPWNCRWVDGYTQQNNTRRNHMVTYNGETHSIAQWSRILGVNHETLRYRVNHENMQDFKEYIGK